jgi:hypothetical protein
MINKVWLPNAGHWAHFTHRRLMQSPYRLRRVNHHGKFTTPSTVLPVDSTNNAACICPMDGNDSLGDCGEAMSCHMCNIWTYGQGKPGFTPVVFDESALEAQYKKVSGGDNGLDEDMVVNSIMKVGVAGQASMVITDALDFDVTNIPLTQYLLDQFYSIALAWSVPDDFISGFAQGTVWPKAGNPDENNGHYTPLASVRSGQVNGQDVTGFYELWTWGTWCLVSPVFVASVEPQCFVAFSPTQFSLATGLDSKGRHITTQAAAWLAIGGNPIPAAVIAAFPPISGPTPTPGPTPVPPVPVPPVNLFPGGWNDETKQVQLPDGYKQSTNFINEMIVVHTEHKIVDLPQDWTVF